MGILGLCPRRRHLPRTPPPRTQQHPVGRVVKREVVQKSRALLQLYVVCKLLSIDLGRTLCYMCNRALQLLEVERFGSVHAFLRMPTTAGSRGRFTVAWPLTCPTALSLGIGEA